MFGVISIASTGAAWLNLRKKQSKLNALIENRDALLAAINTFNRKKGDQALDLANRVDDVQYMDGVLVTSIVRLANLVGKFCYVQQSVVLSNTGDQTYYIGLVNMHSFILAEKLPIMIYYPGLIKDNTELQSASMAQVNKYLNPGETLEIPMEVGITLFADEDGNNRNNDVRKLICQAAGKSLITSCPKLNISNGIVANISIDWKSENGGDTQLHNDVPGVLR